MSDPIDPGVIDSSVLDREPIVRFESPATVFTDKALAEHNLCLWR